MAILPAAAHLQDLGEAGLLSSTIPLSISSSIDAILGLELAHGQENGNE